jgi:uncharacterized repeat protein (TIGR01451 family)
VGVGGVSQVFPANGPIDWDGKGGTTGDVDYIQAINPDCQNPSPGDMNMTGFDDWSNLVYDFRSSSQFADGASRTVPVELTSQLVVAMTPTADLRAAKVVDRSTAQPGDTLAYTVTARNAGPGRAVGVTVDDTLPDGTAQQRAVGTLEPGASKDEAFSYLVPCSTADGTVVTNIAKVSGTNVALVDDPNPSDNQASTATTVQAPKLTLAKAALASTLAGEAIPYTLTYANDGAAPATNVSVTDVLPAGVYYSQALDQGAGPQPTSVVRNGDGTTTLTWNVGTVPASSGPRTIAYTTRSSLLTLGGTALRNTATVSFANANGCIYTGTPATSTTTVATTPPTRDPLSTGYWSNHPADWTAELLARIQATDQRFDGIDGSLPDGRLSTSEVSAALAPLGSQPRLLSQQLLAMELNLASRRINAGTRLSSKLARALRVTTVREAALYAFATLALPYASAKSRYGDATNLVAEVNLNKSEVY